MTYPWQCPYCGREVSLTTNSYDRESGYVRTDDKSKDGDLNYHMLYIVCPNSECKEYTLDISIFVRMVGRNDAGTWVEEDGKKLLSYKLKPRGRAKPFPDYIPEPIRQDYTEACLILQDSPKASAALSRRCLQNLIRAYYGIVKSRLVDEVEALEDQLSPDLWEAVDAIRTVGNIGAHSEKDVNVIIDVPPESANALVELIELLFEETYIKDDHRRKRIERAKQAATAVEDQKNSGSTDSKEAN
jgi:hypothetical protein